MLRFYLLIAGICLLSIVGLRSHYRTDPYWIYFTTTDYNTHKTNLYRVSPDGEVLSLIEQDEIMGLGYLDVSPDGMWVLFYGYDDREQLLQMGMMRHDGRIRVDLSPKTSVFSQCAQFTEDGQWIIYENKPNELRQMRLDGSQDQLIAMIPSDRRCRAYWVVHQDWAEDNSHATYLTSDGKFLITNSTTGIYRSSTDGSDSKLLVSSEDWGGIIVGISPDDQWIFVASDYEDSLFRVSISGGKPLRLANIGYAENEIYMHSMQGNPWHRAYLVILAGGIIMLGIFRPFSQNAII
jgi:hypothetical protein